MPTSSPQNLTFSSFFSPSTSSHSCGASYMSSSSPIDCIRLSAGDDMYCPSPHASLGCSSLVPPCDFWSLERHNRLKTHTQIIQQEWFSQSDAHHCLWYCNTWGQHQQHHKILLKVVDSLCSVCIDFFFLQCWLLAIFVVVAGCWPVSSVDYACPQKIVGLLVSC